VNKNFLSGRGTRIFIATSVHAARRCRWHLGSLWAQPVTLERQTYLDAGIPCFPQFSFVRLVLGAVLCFDVELGSLIPHVGLILTHTFQITLLFPRSGVDWLL